MTGPEVDERLGRLRSELNDHNRIAERLGLDLERPLRSLSDGYPENAIALVGRLTERLLKQLWQHHGIEGDPAAKALNDLIKRCRPHIRSSGVLDALEDIRRLRYRSAHDGYTHRRGGRTAGRAQAGGRTRLVHQHRQCCAERQRPADVRRSRPSL